MRVFFIALRVHEQIEGVLQLDLFEPREIGCAFKVVATNKTCGARNVVRFHEGRSFDSAVRPVGPNV